MKKLSILLAVLSIGLVFVSPVIFAADGTVPPSGTGNLPTTVSGVAKWLCGIIGWMYTILIALGVVFVLVAAFMYVTSQGNMEQVEKANKALMYIAIGIAVAVVSTAIPRVIVGLLGAKDVDVCQTK